jgi:hypothetical protein
MQLVPLHPGRPPKDRSGVGLGPGLGPKEKKAEKALKPSKEKQRKPTPQEVLLEAQRAEREAERELMQVGAVQVASSSPIACNRSTYEAKPFYLSSETLLPIK